MTQKSTDNAHIILDMVNNYAFDSRDVATLCAEGHPTLQQSVMKFCLEYIKAMAVKELPDMRNRASVELAKKLMPLIENKRLPNF